MTFLDKFFKRATSNDGEAKKVERKQLRNIDKRLTQVERRLIYLEKTVQVIRREP